MRDWNWMQPHTINLYEYVGNDPVNKWDPSGLAEDPSDPDGRRDWQDVARESLQRARQYAQREAARKARQGLVYSSNGVRAWASDNAFGFFPPVDPGEFAADEQMAAYNGQQVGHQLAAVQGILEIESGLTTAFNGFIGAVAITLASDGTATPVAVARGGALIVGGMVVFVHGGSTVVIASGRAMDLEKPQAMQHTDGNGRVEGSSTPKKERGGKRASDSSKAEKHGDSGRAQQKAESKIREYESQMEGAPKKERKRLKKKIERVRKDAQKKKSGEPHHN